MQNIKMNKKPLWTKLTKHTTKAKHAEATSNINLVHQKLEFVFYFTKIQVTFKLNLHSTTSNIDIQKYQLESNCFHTFKQFRRDLWESSFITMHHQAWKNQDGVVKS